MGIERHMEAARWHDQQADDLQTYENAVVQSGGWPDTNGRVAEISRHRKAATAIRALISEDGK